MKNEELSMKNGKTESIVIPFLFLNSSLFIFNSLLISLLCLSCFVLLDQEQDFLGSEK